MRLRGLQEKEIYMQQLGWSCPLDRAAWQRISDVTLGFLLNRNVPREEAENITNESLCIALEKYDPVYWQRRGAAMGLEESIRRYAIAVADNQNRAFWRRKKRDEKYLVSMESYIQRGEDESADLMASPEHILQDKQVRSWLEGTLGTLSEKDRIALDLWSRKWSYDDIARHLGATRAAVKSRINKARKKLNERGRNHLEAL